MEVKSLLKLPIAEERLRAMSVMLETRVTMFACASLRADAVVPNSFCSVTVIG